MKNQLQNYFNYCILLAVRTAQPFLQNPLLIIYTPLEHPAAPLPGVHLSRKHNTEERNNIL
jgi:hypothetical protein